MPEIPNLPDLSPETFAAYQRILAGEKLPPDTPGLQELLDVGLAVPHPYEADAYVAVEPRHTYDHMINRAHLQLTALASYMGTLPGFQLQLRQSYETARSSGSIELLSGKKLINTRIAEQQSAVRQLIRTAQPGQRTSEDLTRSRTRDPQSLERGIGLRTVYHSSVRRLANVGEWAKEMAALGAEIRTLDTPFPRIVMYDTQAAFVTVHPEDGAESPTDQSVLIRDPLVCGFISSVFDLFFESADPWVGGRADCSSDQELLTTPKERALLRQLCAGKNQRQAAKALGISEGMVNERVAKLKKAVGVESMNELIYWWARSPDHDVRS